MEHNTLSSRYSLNEWMNEWMHIWFYSPGNNKRSVKQTNYVVKMVPMVHYLLSFQSM